MGDVATNCILLRADRDLLALAERFGETEAAELIHGWIARSEGTFKRFVDPASGMWRSFDQVAGEAVPAVTSAGFLAFWAGLGDDALARQLEAWIAKAPHAVASVAPGDPRFDRKRYWRGPIWAVVNFMVAEGLRETGHAALAERVRTGTRRLIEAAGFHENFDPLDGAGAGGGHFTWTAAKWLAWAR
jgi:glycogen debranching enzyme